MMWVLDGEEDVFIDVFKVDGVCYVLFDMNIVSLDCIFEKILMEKIWCFL